MKCNVCGVDIPEGAAFCSGCGMPAAAPVAPTQQTCPKCGTQARLEAVFCPSCGFRLKAAAAPPPIVGNAWTAAPAPQQTYTPPYAQPAPYQQPQSYAQPSPYPQQQSYAQPMPYPQQAYAQPYTPPKKKHKGAIAAVIVVLVLVLAGAGSWFLFGSKVKRIVLGTKNAYGLIESQNLKADFADLANSMAKIGNLDERAAKGGDAIGIQLQVDEAGLGIDPQTAAAINGLKLKNDLQIDWVSGKPVYYNALGLGVGDENLMTLEVFTEGEAILIGLPEVLDQYIRIDPATLAGVTGGSIDAGGASTMLEAVTLMDMAIDRGALEDSLFQVAKILLDHVDSTEFKSGQELAVGSVTGSYDTYTITLGSESAKAMVIDILTFARGDDTLYNLIGRAVALSEGGSYEPVPLADYQSRIDEAIADMESTEITEPFTMYHTAYVDRNDNIVGRDFRVEDEAGTEMTHVRYAHPTDGASEAIAFELTSDGTDISFLSEYDVSGGLRNGAASMMSAGSEVLSMEFQNLDTVTKDGIDYLVGTVDITPAADAGVPVQSITYTGEMDGETYLLTLDVPGYVSLSIDFARIAAADVSIPDFSGVSAVDVTDSEALQGLMTEDAMNKLMEIVNQLGLPLEGITGTP